LHIVGYNCANILAMHGHIVYHIIYFPSVNPCRNT